MWVYSPLVCILSHKNAVHTFPHHMFKIYFNAVLSSTPSSYKCSVPFMFANQNLVLVENIFYFSYRCNLSHLCFNQPNNIRSGEQVREFLTVQFSAFFHFLFPQVQFSTPFYSQTPGPSSTTSVKKRLVSKIFLTAKYQVRILELKNYSCSFQLHGCTNFPKKYRGYRKILQARMVIIKCQFHPEDQQMLSPTVKFYSLGVHLQLS